MPWAPNYKAVTSNEEVEALAAKIVSEDKPTAIDIETGYHGPDCGKKSLDPTRAFIAGISATNDTSYARYIPLRHDLGPNVPDGLRILRDALLKTDGTTVVPLVAHHKKFESRFMWNDATAPWVLPALATVDWESIPLLPSDYPSFIKHDTMLRSYVLADHKGNGLKSLVLDLLGIKMTEIAELFPSLNGTKIAALRFNTLDLSPAVVSYACEDAAATLALFNLQTGRIKDARCEKLLAIEEEFAYVLADMEEVGLLIDWDMLRAFNEKAITFNQAQHASVLDELSALVGSRVSINLNSTPQLSGVLYDKLGMKTSRKTPKGAPSTDAVALEALARKHPVVHRMLEFREVQATQKRYLDKWPREFSSSPGGVAHPSINQVSVATGRLAISDPSVQQMPGAKTFFLNLAPEQAAILKDAKHPDWQTTFDAVPERDKFKVKFRDSVFAPDDYYILDFDYSQVELRVMAGLSGEQTLIDAFNNGDDVHAITAAMMLGVPQASVTYDQRQVGKALACDELILTPDGWVTIESIKSGDIVCTPDGGSAPVSGYYPQGKRQLFRVTFDDNTSVEADSEHRWAVADVSDYKHPSRELRTLTTSQIREAGLTRANGGPRRVHKWLIPNPAPLALAVDEMGVTVAPYILGALLGDGSLGGNGIVFHQDDQDIEVVERVRSLLSEGVYCDKIESTDLSYRLTSRRKGAFTSPLDGMLKVLGLRGSRREFKGRWGVECADKFIPAEYKFGSEKTRLELLRGLMDTDGCATKKRSAEYVTISAHLAEDVAFVVRSLGGRARIVLDSNRRFEYLGEQRIGRPAYCIAIGMPLGVVPFHIERKKARYGDGYSTKRRLDKRIVSIEPSRVFDAACIMVDHPDHEFITTGVVRTKNTMNFALLYGMGVRSLADRLAVSQERAAELYNNYFSGFSSITTWMDRMKREGMRSGETTSWLGRKFTIWELQSTNMALISKGERLCVNAPVQGGAADYMKVAMLRVKRAMTKKGLWRSQVRLVLNNHDALSFYVSNDIPPAEAIAMIRAAVEFQVPNLPKIVAEFSIGQRWGSMTPCDERSSFQRDILDRHWKVMEGAIARDPELESPDELESIDVEVTTSKMRKGPIEEDLGADDVPDTLLTSEEREAKAQAPSYLSSSGDTGNKASAIGADMESANRALTDASPPIGKRIIIEIGSDALIGAVTALGELLDKNPGPNPVTVRTIHGDIERQKPTSLGIDDAASISMTVGGASVYHPESEVDASAFADITF